MSQLAHRLRRHLLLASLAAFPAAIARAEVVHHFVNWPVPANAAGLYINVETLTVSSNPAAVPGWDINAYSAGGLYWFNAPGSGMLLPLNSVYLSAGSHAMGWGVDPLDCTGAGPVVAGLGRGDWRLNDANDFGFKFVGSDGQTRVGWGRMEVGPSLAHPSRRIVEIAWETDPVEIILIGAGSVAPNDEPERPRPLLDGSDVLHSILAGTPSADAFGCPDLVNSAPDVWFSCGNGSEHGVLRIISICVPEANLGYIGYRRDPATAALVPVECQTDCFASTFNDYQAETTFILTPRPASGPLLIRTGPFVNPSSYYSLLEDLRASFTPLPNVGFYAGTLWAFGQATDAKGNSSTSSGKAGGMTSATTGNGSGGTGSGLVTASGSLSIVVDPVGEEVQVRVQGTATAQQPEGYGGSAGFSLQTSDVKTGETTPLQFSLGSDMYYRIESASGSVSLEQGTGCICGPQLRAGTYTLTVALGVSIGDDQTLATSTLNWKLRLRPTPFPVADLSNDGVVNAADLSILLAAWGSPGPGDLDGSGLVDAADAAILLGAWGS